MEKLILKITDLNLWDENPRFPEEYFNGTSQEFVQERGSKELKSTCSFSNL